MDVAQEDGQYLLVMKVWKKSAERYSRSVYNDVSHEPKSVNGIDEATDVPHILMQTKVGFWVKKA